VVGVACVVGVSASDVEGSETVGGTPAADSWLAASESAPHAPKIKLSAGSAVPKRAPRRMNSRRATCGCASGRIAPRPVDGLNGLSG
jgi:hypothetical protein